MKRFASLWRGSAAALVVGLLSLIMSPTAAAAASADETLLLTLTNTARAAAGAPALTLDSGLSAIARNWASSMASAGAISHNDGVKSQLAAAGYDWRKTGENVGMGPTVASIHEALLASPGHFRNIVDPDFRRVGLGIVIAKNTVWIVQNFLMPAGSGAVASAKAVAAAVEEPAPAPPAPATTPTTRPAAKVTTTVAPAPTTTTTSTTLPPAPTTTVAAPVPPVQGLPLRLTLMLQQLKSLPTRS